MKAVAAGDEVAGELLRLPLPGEENARARGIEIGHGDVCDFEEERAAEGEALVDEIPDDFALGIDGDGAAGERGKIDAVRAAGEAQVDAVMHQTFALHSCAHAHFGKQIDGVLLEQAGADALLTIFAAAGFEDDGFDAGKMQQMREDESGGTGSDDADLGARGGQRIRRRGRRRRSRAARR